VSRADRAWQRLPALLTAASLVGAIACSSTAPQPVTSINLSTPLTRADFSAWEEETRDRADALMDLAQASDAQGAPDDAAACAKQALETALSPPNGYPVTAVYLDYIAELLAESTLVGVAPTRPDVGDAADQPNEEGLLEMAAADNVDVEPAPQVEEPAAVPISDLPLTVNPQVQHFLDAFTHESEYRRRLEVGLQRSGHYLPMILSHLSTADLPSDLAYLPLIESAFSVKAYSRARAMGMWQFIASTARLYGLRVSPLVDERRDPERATEAAVAHLADLYSTFGDWNLALAAYNSGAGNVRRAIRRAHSHDFWEIRRYLPRETRNYVPAFLASVIVAKNPEKYGFEPPPDGSPWEYDEVTVPDALDLQFLADNLGVPADRLRELNPAVRRDLTPAGRKTRLRLPAGTADEAQEILQSVPRAKWAPRLVHTVRRGESLYLLARRYGSSVRAIRQANGLHRNLIHPGQALIVPRLGYSSVNTARPARRSVGHSGTYQVRSNDTLWDIARSFDVTVDHLCAANGITRRATIRPGQTLAIPGSPRETRRIAAVHHTYRVRRGDTLYDIARRFGTSVPALKRANGIRGSRIHPGDVLRIPRSQLQG